MSPYLSRTVRGVTAACVAATVVILSTSVVSSEVSSVGGGSLRSVSGGSSVGAPLPLIRVEPHATDSDATPPGPGSCGCYEPAQFQAAYDLGPLYANKDTGAGETVVVVDAFGSNTIQNDLRTFDTGFDLPPPPSFKIIAPEGAITGSNASWATETTLDVEYSHAIAPGANILLVETPVAETEGAVGFKQIVAAENYVISNEKSLGIAGGAVISQSFGATEQTFGSGFAAKIAPFRTAFTAARSAGVTVLGASGDFGATNCSNAANPCACSCPQSQFLALERSTRHECRGIAAHDQHHRPVPSDESPGGLERRVGRKRWRRLRRIRCAPVPGLGVRRRGQVARHT